MANQNMQNQQPNRQQNPKQGQAHPTAKNAERANDDRQPSSSAAGRGHQPGNPQHTPGQTAQPKNARQFQSSETNLDEEQDSNRRNIDVEQDEDDLSQPRQ